VLLWLKTPVSPTRETAGFDDTGESPDRRIWSMAAPPYGQLSTYMDKYSIFRHLLSQMN